MADYIDLDEAIKHAEETAKIRTDLCAECRAEHKQLADWLKELREYRKADVVPRSEVEELQQKLNDYERVCGKLSFDGNRALIVLSETTKYIPKNVADKFKNIAVHKSKQEVAKDILGELSSHTSIGIRHLKELMAECDNEENKIWLEGKISELCNIEKIISEYEKKYIGE